ncbi:hypothetical protein [Arthrobacter sp. TMN-50]
MAIGLILDLNQAVSVQDLKQFLSYVPEGFDSELDLRVASTDRFRREGLPDYLQLRIPESATPI